MQEVSVIIPNYNGMAYLEGVLREAVQLVKFLKDLQADGQI